MVNGWEKVDQDEENDNWVATEEADCQRNYEHFVHDLIESMDARYNTCVSTLCWLLKCMDLEEIFTLLADSFKEESLLLMKFKQSNLEMMFQEVCGTHRQTQTCPILPDSNIADGRLEMEPGLSHVIYRKMKQALKNLLWEKKDVMLKWFLLTTKRKSLTCLATEVTSNASALQSFALSVPEAKLPRLDVQFKITFCDDE